MSQHLSSMKQQQTPTTNTTICHHIPSGLDLLSRNKWLFKPAKSHASRMWMCSFTCECNKWVSSSIPSYQILTAHAQPFKGTRDLAFCLKVPLDSLPVWASSGGSGETARMRRLAWTFTARIGDKYQIRLTRPKLQDLMQVKFAREGSLKLKN